jgi:hypothetical protein
MLHQEIPMIWTTEKIEGLDDSQLAALLANATRLKNTELAELCGQLVAARSLKAPAKRAKPAIKPARAY